MINEILSMQMVFSIKECKCTNFNFTEFAKSNKNVIPFDKYSFDFAIAINILPDEKLIKIDLGAKLFTNSEIKEQVANLESTHQFFMQNFDEISIKKEDGKIEIPEPIIPPLLGISISNMRGMFSIKMENTIYSNAIVPVLDASQLLPKRTINLG